MLEGPKRYLEVIGDLFSHSTSDFLEAFRLFPLWIPGFEIVLNLEYSLILDFSKF